MKEIAQEESGYVTEMFKRTVNEEKEWANYLFKQGSLIGLNDRLLYNYVEWIANRRMKAVGIKPIYDIPAKNNPLPWTEHWLNSKGQQNAPQETEIESYVVGGIKQDVKQEPSQDFLSDAEWDDPRRKFFDEVLDHEGQFSNPHAELLWEAEKKKALQQQMNVTHVIVLIRVKTLLTVWHDFDYRS